jgi:hypothetical protein
MYQKEPSDWRNLCEAAAVEEDSTKLAGLVAQIIRTLDGEQSGSQRTASSMNSSLRSPADQR